MMSNPAPEIRNPAYNRDGSIDCEIRDAEFGWIAFTASAGDVSAEGRAIFERAKAMSPKAFNAGDPILLEAEKAQAVEYVHGFAAQVRASVAGTSDPAKFAEYADKAAHAQAIVDGTASADLMAEARLEAKSLGFKDAAAMAKVWQKKAGELRHRRAEINVMIREAISKIGKAKAVDAIAAITKHFTDQMVEKTGTWGVESPEDNFRR